MSFPVTHHVVVIRWGGFTFTSDRIDEGEEYAEKIRDAVKRMYHSDQVDVAVIRVTRETVK